MPTGTFGGQENYDNPNLSPEQNAAQRKIGLIINPVYIVTNTITISHTSNSTEGTAATLLNSGGASGAYVVGPLGALVYKMAITWDSNAALGVKYKITGLNIANNVFNPMPANATNIDLIPDGTAIFVAPNSQIQIYAYVYTGTNDGTMTALLMVDQL